MSMRYGLIGGKLGHSYSAVIHRMLGNGHYVLHELAPGAVDSFLYAANFEGVNVTIPYKQTVMPYCIVDSAAGRIGSVNTMVKRDGALYGYNTDYFGFIYMCRRIGVDFGGKRVVILGSGGTSKTAATVAADGGASEIIVVSRSGACNYDNLPYDADILINTTPVGMYPHMDAAPVPLERFTRLSAVVDVIYNPMRTDLLIDARRLGIPHTGGLSMLVAQAVRAHELFFDTMVEDGVIEDVLGRLERMCYNIALIGMPGSGKSTHARRMADKYDMTYVDTDDNVHESTGRTPAEIITSDGEAAFRAMESRVLAEACAGGGRVIATGGGAVLDPQSRHLLQRHCKIIYLQRDIAHLATDDRPLSVDLLKLYVERRPIYESLYDERMVIED